MRRFLRRILSTPVIIVLVTLILSLAVWFYGPLLAIGESRPFDGVIARSVTIGVLWLIAIVWIVVRWLVRRKRDKELVEDIVEAAEEVDPADEMVKAELDDLRGKLRGAMATLRKSRTGRKQLYELPWYVIVGPPGAGKTTAIVNSGLNFPLADEMGKSAVGGVGGTRNCDWWFTDEAVLLDTAGRYTTQESDAEADNAAWLGFLGLLKKYRPRQPINGAIVAISLSDLSLQDEVTQKSHAAAVRRRLNELREKLGVKFPVYVLFTKADLIAGFAEFYDNLGKEDREQVWGFTLDYDEGKGQEEKSPVESFDPEFGALLERLNSQLLERMQIEVDPQRRSLIAGFPSQVASVRSVARDFLSEVFQENRYEKRHLLRGVYFTSGTQEGTPIDRLMMGMARSFGIGRQALGSGQGSGRSFFLTRLFETVMFGEAGLVSADDWVERRYRWTKYGAITATVLIAVAAGGLWTRSYLGNTVLLEEAEAKVDEYQAAAATIPGSPVGDTDIPAIVPALNILREMPGNPALEDLDPPNALQWGLYQGDVVGTEAAQAYRSALNTHLLPRLLLRLEEQIQGNLNNPDLLYEALKIYLMLGLQGPMNKDLVAEWMAVDWSLAYPGPTREELRRDLAGHLDTMLSEPMEQIALNGPLVEQVQGILTEMPLAQRVYNGIIKSPAAVELPEWRLTDIGGPAVSRVLVRSSGKPLNEGIEGIFTYKGFNEVFLGEALGVAKRIQSESWVLGPRGEAEQSEEALLAMSRDVLDLYYNDYIARYDQMLGDVDIIPMESLSHAVEVTNVLSGPTSPLVNLLNGVSKETKLTEDRNVLPTDGVTEGVSSVVDLELSSSLNVESQRFLNALTSAAAEGSQEVPKEPGQYVEERFEWLHNMVARPEGQPSQLDGVMGLLTAVYQELNKLSFSGGVASPPTGEVTALQQFQQASGRMEGPLQRWATQVSTGSSGITAEGNRAGINAAWQAQVLPFCQQALSNRYPFDRQATADVTMSDFQKLFAPGGLIETFFNKHLIQYVDQNSRPWKWKRVNDTDLGISNAVLQQMQYAAEIRDAFFAGGVGASINFQITPEALDPKAKEVALEVDGQSLIFNHRMQPKPRGIKWPGDVGVASVILMPAASGRENRAAKQGPWAWFRLLDGAEMRKTNVSDRSRVIFNIGGRIVIFQLQAGSVLNPFSLPALAKFSCPSSF